MKLSSSKGLVQPAADAKDLRGVGCQFLVRDLNEIGELFVVTATRSVIRPKRQQEADPAGWNRRLACRIPSLGTKGKGCKRFFQGLLIRINRIGGLLVGDRIDG